MYYFYMQFKEIYHESVITEFGIKDDSLYIHFAPGKKLKDISKIDSVLDKHLKLTFYQDIKPTGETIKKELENIDLKQQFSPKEEERVNFGARSRSMFYKERLPKERPEDFKKAQELYRDLMKLYDVKGVIHKSWTDELNGRTWNEGWGYIVHYKSPFIDELMLKMTKDINEELLNQGFVNH